MGKAFVQAALWLLLAGQCLGQTTTSSASGSCPTVLQPKSGEPIVASGYSAQLIANGLTKPRGIIFDKSGALLVVQQNVGIVRLTWIDNGGTCLNVANQTTVITNNGLNHGIEFSPDGKTLYASSTEAVYSWPYDPTTGSVGSSTQLVKNMTNTDHSTRTLLLSKKYPELLLVSRGSSENIDPIALDETSGHSFIKAFNLSERGNTVWNYPTDGKLLGWGLRNDVGVAEHPVTGGIWSVENSADDIERLGTDIHLENPAEELNFLGYLNGSTEDQGGNYGYPNCFALWNTTGFPSVGDLKVGSQFALSPNASVNDTSCNDNYVAPRLVFLAHTAPLDIKFTPDGSLAYITFHGSWDRQPPSGYNLGVVSFGANGEPVEPSTSNMGSMSVLSNADNTKCPNGCFRPVGLALDSQGRIFMSSDASGEIFVVQKSEVTASTTSASSSGTFASATTGASSAASSTAGSANAASVGVSRASIGTVCLVAGIAALLSFAGYIF